MALGTGGQVDRDKALSSLDSAQGRVFEAAYEPGDPNTGTVESFDLSKIPEISDEVRGQIDSVYARFGGHEQVLRRQVERIDLSGVPDAEKAEVRKARVLEIAQRMYGPFRANAELIFGNLELNAADSQERALLADVLGDGLPSEPAALEGRKMLRVALSKIDPSMSSEDRMAFLRDVIGAVDFAKLAEEESRIEPLKDELKAVTNAANDVRAGKHLDFAKHSQKTDKVFTDADTADAAAVDDIDKLSLKRDRGILVQIEEAKDAISTNRTMMNTRTATPQQIENSRRAMETATKRKNALESLNPKELRAGLTKIMGIVQVCHDLKIQIGTLDVAALKGLLDKYSKMGDDISHAEIQDLYGNGLGNALGQIDATKIATAIARGSGPLREAVGKQEGKVAKLRKQEKDAMNLSDEDFALAMNKHLISKNPETSGLNDKAREELAKAMLLRDLTSSDNDEYFERVAESVDPKVLEDKEITDKILKFGFHVLEPGSKDSKQHYPLLKVTLADLSADDELALGRALRAGKFGKKGQEWQSLFILMMSFEKSGEKHSPRAVKIERAAREYLAAAIGVKATSAECEEAFQDQVALLQPAVDSYFTSHGANTYKRRSLSSSLIQLANEYVDEGLRTGQITYDDFNTVKEDLEGMGYFEAERRLDDGTVGILPKDDALNILEDMFSRIPDEQKKADRARTAGKEGLGLGGKLLKTVGLGTGKGFLLGSGWMAWKMLDYGIFKPVMLPFRGIKGTLSSYKESAVADSRTVFGKSGETIKNIWGSTKAGVVNTWNSGKTTLADDLGDNAYAKRTTKNLDKLKAKAGQAGKDLTKVGIE
ncbi:hypothetical protein HY605_00995, partial [Candidatus Peregrinibacteria bacterium]|nr:hypothetical protein [Candidatus Peregrinibacteria bacterium]